MCCTIENQKNADYKLGIFSKLPIRYKCITAQPLIEAIEIEGYLDDIELVVVGGESDYCARPLDYAWVIDIREQYIRKNVSFEFRQCGTHFIKDGRIIVLINDVRFKSRRSFDWDTIEEYILALISPMSSVIQKIK